jgi:hypothetical protein
MVAMRMVMKAAQTARAIPPILTFPLKGERNWEEFRLRSKTKPSPLEGEGWVGGDPVGV